MGAKSDKNLMRNSNLKAKKGREQAEMLLRWNARKGMPERGIGNF